MKKSELKLLQERLKRASQPPPPSKKRDDLSDELSKMFDDGTLLESEKGAPPLAVTPPAENTQATQGSRRTSLPSTSAQAQPVAPVRDYMKVANSIHREAVPAGLFKGKSKLIYDYLYSRTRGAVVPTRTVQVSRREIMEKAGIGSDKTIRENLLHLRSVGLISWGGSIGAQGGNVYAIYLPEEALATLATQGSQGTQGSPGQFLPTVPTVETTQGSQGLSVESNNTSGGSKTSFKTNTIDDDETQALSDLNSALSEATRKLMGRAPRASEREQWKELAQVLIEELNDAAARAESVSSVPAFLAAHLRRKLAPKPVARKREGNKADVGLPPASLSNPDARLTPEEIESFTSTVVDLLGEGKSVAEVEACYAPSMHPADWATVKNVALAQSDKNS